MTIETGTLTKMAKKNLTTGTVKEERTLAIGLRDQDGKVTVRTDQEVVVTITKVKGIESLEMIQTAETIKNEEITEKSVMKSLEITKKNEIQNIESIERREMIDHERTEKQEKTDQEMASSVIDALVVRNPQNHSLIIKNEYSVITLGF